FDLKKREEFAGFFWAEISSAAAIIRGNGYYAFLLNERLKDKLNSSSQAVVTSLIFILLIHEAKEACLRLSGKPHDINTEVAAEYEIIRNYSILKANDWQKLYELCQQLEQETYWTGRLLPVLDFYKQLINEIVTKNINLEQQIERIRDFVGQYPDPNLDSAKFDSMKMKNYADNTIRKVLEKEAIERLKARVIKLKAVERKIKGIKFKERNTIAHRIWEAEESLRTLRLNQELRHQRLRKAVKLKKVNVQTPTQKPLSRITNNKWYQEFLRCIRQKDSKALQVLAGRKNLSKLLMWYIEPIALKKIEVGDILLDFSETEGNLSLEVIKKINEKPDLTDLSGEIAYQSKIITNIHKRGTMKIQTHNSLKKAWGGRTVSRLVLPVKSTSAINSRLGASLVTADYAKPIEMKDPMLDFAPLDEALKMLKANFPQLSLAQEDERFAGYAWGVIPSGAALYELGGNYATLIDQKLRQVFTQNPQAAKLLLYLFSVHETIHFILELSGKPKDINSEILAELATVKAYAKLTLKEKNKVKEFSNQLPNPKRYTEALNLYGEIKP
ncbi:MAG: hypothetical protein NTW13_05280, partial [Candidatus Omnitrophica bacterium]|nr:hypothetical protein [Candidatus Omnitrophota bacterium]